MIVAVMCSSYVFSAIFFDVNVQVTAGVVTGIAPGKVNCAFTVPKAAISIAASIIFFMRCFDKVTDAYVTWFSTSGIFERFNKFETGAQILLARLYCLMLRCWLFQDAASYRIHFFLYYRYLQYCEWRR
jgi:hypothetical protein